MNALTWIVTQELEKNLPAYTTPYISSYCQYYPSKHRKATYPSHERCKEKIRYRGKTFICSCACHSNSHNSDSSKSKLGSSAYSKNHTLSEIPHAPLFVEPQAGLASLLDKNLLLDKRFDNSLNLSSPSDSNAPQKTVKAE